MRILVDITHPADVHFFRKAIQHWQAQSENQVLVTSRNKDVVLQLLDEFNLPHTQVGKQARGGLFGLAIELLERSWGLRRLVNEFKPNVAMGFGGTFIAYACVGRNIPVVIFTDTEATLANTITIPLATVVATPTFFKKDFGEKQVRFNAVKELAYTHPDVFQPDPIYLRTEGLEPDEPFSILRLVSWQASHDVQMTGIPDIYKVVETLSSFGRVLISSEKSLFDDLKSLQMKGSAGNMLHLQAFARLLFGESGTMATECALLGTPAIFYNPTKPSTILTCAERYGMVFPFHDTLYELDEALAKAVELLKQPDGSQYWQFKRQQMLSDMIDVNDYVINLTEQVGSSSPHR